jgi:hypothetical protein
MTRDSVTESGELCTGFCESYGKNDGRAARVHHLWYIFRDGWLYIFIKWYGIVFKVGNEQRG